MAYASARCSTGPASSRCLWCAPCCDVASSDRSTTFCPEAEDDSIADLRRCMASLDHAMGAFKSESTSRSGVPSLARCTYSCSRLPQALALISFTTQRTYAHAHRRAHTQTQTRACTNYLPRCRPYGTASSAGALPTARVGLRCPAGDKPRQRIEPLHLLGADLARHGRRTRARVGLRSIRRRARLAAPVLVTAID